MLLVARVSIVQRDALWSKLNIGSITEIRNRILGAPIILVVTAIILIAAIGAPLRVYVVRAAIDVWNWGRDPLTVFEDDFARLFSGITSKNDVNGRFFGNTLPFIGKISFGGDVVMIANSNTPTYWLSRSYSHYTSKGWIAGKTIKFNVGPEGLPPPPHESDNRELAFQRVQLTFDSDELFVGGNVDWVSHDAVVETLEPRVFHIDLKTPALDAELPADIQELAAELRNLLNPPPNRFIESLIAEVMPDDLIILDVIPGSESEQWRDQKAITLRRKDPEIPEVVNWEFKQTQPQDEPYTLYSFVSQASNNELQEAGDDYPTFITDHYLQLPITLPDRVRDLAERITEGAETPLDKALAVQSYLRSEGGFEYSQDIESPPPNADGVDWFLFETKTGYSDYFGSAMTVMLRSVDVPARMAAGYAPGRASTLPDAGPSATGTATGGLRSTSPDTAGSISSPPPPGTPSTVGSLPSISPIRGRKTPKTPWPISWMALRTKVPCHSKKNASCSNRPTPKRRKPSAATTCWSLYLPAPAPSRPVGSPTPWPSPPGSRSLPWHLSGCSSG